MDNDVKIDNYLIVSNILWKISTMYIAGENISTYKWVLTPALETLSSTSWL